jgi:hypothetical protein
MGGASGGTAGVGIGQIATDERLRPSWYWHEWLPWINPREPFMPMGYQTGWWPGGGGLDASGNECIEATWYEQPEFNTGCISRFAITGVTRDVYASALPGAVVKLFKTADGSYVGTKDTKIDEGVSDPVTGAFYLTTPYYPDTHYVVMQKSGTPDVQGVTVNTLIGS